MKKNEEIDLRRIFKIIFSNKIVFATILLVSIILGYTYSYYYNQPQYESSVTILLVADENKIEKEVDQTDLTLNSGLISTYINIATSSSVIEKTIQNLELDIPVENLQNEINATQINGTHFLKISVKDNNPETAQKIANELTNVFSEQIKEIYNLENMQVVDQAEVENIPVNINHIKDIILSLGCGISLIFIIVAILYFFDETVKNEKDIEENLDLRVLGTIPNDKENSGLIVENNPKSYIQESIKIIRTNILYMTNKKSVLITSNKNKEGKTWVANNLAVTLAQAGKKVILVDANLRINNNMINSNNSQGLSDFINEISEDDIKNLEIAKKYVKEGNISNLWVLSNGTIPPNPTELLSSVKMRRLIELLENMYDIIIFDGVSCMLVSDSIALSNMVDGTVIVAESKKTRIKDLKNVKKSITDVNGKILGVIINKEELSKNKYYGKKYGYYYNETPERKNKKQEKIVTLDEIIEDAKVKIKMQSINKIEKVALEKIDEENQNNEANDKEETNSLKQKAIEEIGKLKEYIIRENNSNKNKYIQEIESLKEYRNADMEEIKKLQEDIEKLNNELKELKELQIKANAENIEITKPETVVIKEEPKIYKNNIISFDTLKEKRRKKKSEFNINEDIINYVDLERLAIEEISLNKNNQIEGIL